MKAEISIERGDQIIDVFAEYLIRQEPRQSIDVGCGVDYVTIGGFEYVEFEPWEDAEGNIWELTADEEEDITREILYGQY